MKFERETIEPVFYFVMQSISHHKGDLKAVMSQ